MLSVGVGGDRSRRAELIEQLADHVLAGGLAAASLRPLAAAVGTSDRMLLYYFADKAALLTAVLGTIAARMTALLEANAPPRPVAARDLERRLLPFVLDDALWPFMALWLEIAGSAARGDPVCRAIGGAVANGFLDWTAAQLIGATAAARRRAATRVLMTIEGGVLLKSLGLGDAVAAAYRSAG